MRVPASLTDLLGTNGRNRLTRAQRSRTRVTHADYIGYDSHGELAAIIVHGWIAARVWCGSEGWMDTWLSTVLRRRAAIARTSARLRRRHLRDRDRYHDQCHEHHQCSHARDVVAVAHLGLNE